MRVPSARLGLFLLGLLSVSDIASLPLGDGKHPPLPVLALGAVLGVVSLTLLPRAWRDRQADVRWLVVTRVLSALTAVPALLISGVPTAGKVGAGVFTVLTALGVALISRQPQLQPQRSR